MGMDMTLNRKLATSRVDAEIQDAARLANDLQREFPSMTRTAALHEAERIQRKHGLGMAIQPADPQPLGHSLHPVMRQALAPFLS